MLGQCLSKVRCVLVLLHALMPLLNIVCLQMNHLHVSLSDTPVEGVDKILLLQRLSSKRCPSGGTPAQHALLS